MTAPGAPDTRRAALADRIRAALADRIRAALADRIRAALADHPTTREVAMFGGVSFMVDEKMVVAADRGGNLLARIDPARSRELLVRPGAERAEMGPGRTMGPGWISVAGDAIATADELAFWIDVAMEHNAASSAGDR